MRKIIKMIYMVSMLAVMTIIAGCGFEETAASDEQVLSLSVATEPVMDPAIINDAYSEAMVKNIFDGLARPTNEGEIVPAVAESWDVSEDGQTYTFHIREDATWNNGEAITAQDFEYSWKRIVNPETGSPNASSMFMIQGAEEYYMGEGSADEMKATAIDEDTFEVVLTEEAPYFPELTARSVAMMPVHQETVEANPSWATEAGEGFVANGPFNLTEWNHNGNYTVEQNENYWDIENVSLDRVEVQIIENPTTANASFQNGDLDYIGIPFNTIPADAIDAYKEEETLKVTDIGAIYMYKLNTTDEVMQNVHMRRALAYAIDRQDLIDNVVKGNQVPALGAVAPTAEGFEEDRGHFQDAHYETARKELEQGMEELGYEKASEIPITIETNDNDSHIAVAQYIQEDWKNELKIEAEISTAEMNVHFDNLNQMNYQIGRTGPTVDYNDPNAFLEHFYSVDDGTNQTGWENEEYQTLLDAAIVETDEAKQMEMYKNAEEIIMSDMPFIPIYYYSNPQVINEDVEGFFVDGMVDVQLKEVSINQDGE